MPFTPKPRIRTRTIRPSPAPVRRTAGQKAGLTIGQILAAARTSLACRPGPLTVQAVAANLGVAHNSIGSRLRRGRTTLELELAKEFLLNISRPMLPGEEWRSYLRSLFQTAVHEGETHPGLARTAALWIAHDPNLCRDFTERVLHLLGSAGLSDEACVVNHDIVLAALCGMLVIRFPDVGGNPDTWAEAIAQNMTGIDARRLPLMHRNREALAALARQKVSAREKPDSEDGFALATAALVIGCIDAMVG